ncbi:hypothetical protein ACFX5K_01210 [Rickettsiales bacterium LUAb2]
MLPLEMKENIQNGTMKAFVSKEPRFKVGEQFYFHNYNPNRIDVSSMFWTDLVYAQHVIAKAKCVGVVEGALSIHPNDPFSTYFDTFIGEIGVRDEGAKGINLLNILGWDDDKNGASLAYDYYKTLLGEDLTGYVHLFEVKTVKENK